MKSASGHTSSTRDLISFLQFEKREKHAWRNVTFSKDTGRGVRPATLLKVTLFHECFSRFLNCTNGTKSGKASQLLPKPRFSPKRTVLKNFAKFTGNHLFRSLCLIRAIQNI